MLVQVPYTESNDYINSNLVISQKKMNQGYNHNHNSTNNKVKVQSRVSLVVQPESQVRKIHKVVKVAGNKKKGNKYG